MHIYERLGVHRVINARSFSTKIGGSALPSEVLDAMRSASECCVRMDELQEAASSIISRATGAEAGVVTSGASAALTLAAAACIAGLDVTCMNALPDTAGMPNEIIVHRAHRNDYDHALRAAGARLIDVGFNYCTFPYEVEHAINARTAAMFWLAGRDEGVLPLDQFASIAHRHNLPVIVDAAPELPPAGNLKRFISDGADLVAFSGGKHLRGPQASGVLCGRRDLIFSAALQHQDMDVFPETWPLRQLLDEGKLSGPPHHGIGRGFKVGKEEVVGLLTAIQLYEHRDFESERRQWMNDLECVIADIRNLPGISARIIYPQPKGRDVPNALIDIDPAVAGIDAVGVVRALQEGTPPISVFERFVTFGRIVIMPEALLPGDAAVLSRRLKETLAVNGS